MAKDIKLKFDDLEATGDFELDNGDLLREEGLETAVRISLFTDARADEFDDLDDPNDKRGWWGDQLSEYEEDKIGSKLWLLKRSKTTQDVVSKAKIYALEALEWMVEDEVASNIDVITEAIGEPSEKILAMAVMIKKFDNTIEVFKFDDLWNAQLGV